MLKLIFVTGNKNKLEQARKAIVAYPINLVNRKIDVPEIQDLNLQKIAKFSAKFACEKLGKPVVTTDAGYYIKSLNDFPGPFVKFFNQWFKPDDLLRLMKGKGNRLVESPVWIAYCEPGKKPVSFCSKNFGTIALNAEGEGTTIDQLYIPKGRSRTLGSLPEAERLSIWSTEGWIALAKYITKRRKV